MRRLLLLVSALTLASVLAGYARADDDDDGETKAWRVTVTNLTPAGSQPLSPPLLVVHSRAADVWSVGEIASHGVAAIAEDADNSVLESAFPHVNGVKNVATGAGGPIPSGQSRTFGQSSRRAVDSAG